MARTAVAPVAARSVAARPFSLLSGRPHAATCASAALPSQQRALHSSVPHFSQPAWAAKGVIAYEELKPLTQSPPADITVIDVREPDEVAAGIIPSAVNVPLSELEIAFNPDKEYDFRNKYAFDRPAPDAKIIVYCRSGKRSRQAQEFLNHKNWKK